MLGGLGTTLSKMTKPFNAIKSTMKSGIAGYQQAYGAGMKSYGKAYGGGVLSRGTSAQVGASSALDAMKGMNRGQLVGMGAVGAGATMGGMAAADFMNPWGLGWGD